MTWYKETINGKVIARWSEEYPGHHKLEFEFDLLELKQQLGLVEISEEVQ